MSLMGWNIKFYLRLVKHGSHSPTPYTVSPGFPQAAALDSQQKARQEFLCTPLSEEKQRQEQVIKEDGGGGGLRFNHLVMDSHSDAL